MILFSEIVEALKPQIVVILLSTLKEIFAQGAKYVHELFEVEKYTDIVGGLPTVVGYKFRPAEGWEVEKSVDLSTVDGAELDKTNGIIDINYIEQGNDFYIVRIENMQYYVRKIK